MTLSDLSYVDVVLVGSNVVLPCVYTVLYKYALEDTHHRIHYLLLHTVGVLTHVVALCIHGAAHDGAIHSNTTGWIPYTQMLCMLLHYTQYVVT